ncbi:MULTISPECIES: hypothetical protein [Pseudovibrio]|uniref:hypothetical protein n=1 Tax=Stappiaceae TaxID=2821832 RepID=UPI0023664676|nr:MULTISPECIES: hypothetical protein [Pseudovibrio]MDD7908711.1 hypothetical protein [Pseudovibrio exalbescens]MDX5592784.1 hypothetical protein [Pseudovibrio sp. SPO723]
MKRLFALALFGALFSTSGLASEVYMISRDNEGEFVGSHKMFSVAKDGHKRVKICGSNFWLRPYTVVWSKWEEQSGRQVTLEGHKNGRWDILCDNPTEHVSLRQVGVYVSLEDAMLNARNITTDRKNRFEAIRKTFNDRSLGSKKEEESPLLPTQPYDARP